MTSTPLHPELAAAGAPPDATAVSYQAAADVLNGGTHAARDGYEPRPVDEDQLDERVNALRDTGDALLVATAVLRDAITGEDPAVGEHLNRAVTALHNASKALDDTHRHLAGPVTPDAGDDE